MTVAEHLHTLLNTLLVRNASGGYVSTLYFDYRDTLTAEQLAAIATADGFKMDAFYDELEDTVDTWQEEAFIALMDELRAGWCNTVEPLEGALAWDAVRDVVHDLVLELVTFNIDYNHFLNQRIYVNVLLNTGDGNADFTCNNLIPARPDQSITIPPESSLLWLVRQQGYTLQDLYQTIAQGGSHQSRLLQSIYDECDNAPSLMNALTFFVTMSLRQYIDWVDSGRDLTVSAETACGLWDPWTGGGSTLEIALEQPVTIPARYAEPAFDGVRGNYSVADTYGMLRRFWTDTALFADAPRNCA